MLSRFIRNVIASPPSPQPKHLNVPRAGDTVKLGVRSWWKGHSPLYAPPVFRSRTVSSTMGTISIAALTRSTDSSLIRGIYVELRDESEREAIGHSRKVVGRVRDRHAALVDELREDPPDGRARRLVLLLEVDALEHERAQVEHRRPEGVALDDVAGDG